MFVLKIVCLKSTESLLKISIKHVLLVSTKIKERLCVSCELLVDPSPQTPYGRRLRLRTEENQPNGGCFQSSRLN